MNEELKATEEKLPIGIAFNPESTVFKNVYFADLLKLTDALNSLLLHVKNEGNQEGSIKHYYETDLVDAIDENGNVILLQDGVTPQKEIRKDFWKSETNQQ